MLVFFKTDYFQLWFLFRISTAWTQKEMIWIKHFQTVKIDDIDFEIWQFNFCMKGHVKLRWQTF